MYRMFEKVLPAKYYLDHFIEFISFLKEKYQHLFKTEHQQFLSDFENLSEDAQCIFVRMSNRKGRIFYINDLQYEEICDLNKALVELSENKFISYVGEVDVPEVIHFLSKPQLVSLLTKAGQNFKKSLKKEDLIQLAKSVINFSMLKETSFFNELYVQNKTTELDYLSFLYFGEIQKNLSLYTLRDLDIRQANQKRTEFKARFESLLQADTHYFYAKLFDQFDSCSQIPVDQWPTPIDEHTRIQRGEAILTLAQMAESDEKISLALQLYSQAQIHPAREKKIRLLSKRGKKKEAYTELNQILDQPYTTEEVIFAEDYLERKFHKKRTSRLTDILRNAAEVWLDDAYYRKPEKGVVDLFINQGHIAHESENFLWNSLFGLVFWDELFESDKAAIYNTFERRSVTVIGPEFFRTHEQTIEDKLKIMMDPFQTLTMISKTMREHEGTLNQIFHWHQSTQNVLTDFLNHAAPASVVYVLKKMAENYDARRTGFPDLFVIKDEQIQFLEIKAEGDQLKSHQLDQIKLLQDAGFAVDLLKVKWAYNPSQVYVVVDVETTGGRADWHRLTELAALKIQNGQVIGQFQSLINPGRSIPRNITELTGITNEMVAGAPDFSKIAEAFDEFSKNAIFAAHFSRFDYSFIQAEYRRLDINYIRPTFCTCSQSRKHFPGLNSYKLSRLCEYFNIPLESHHRALCDAQAATEILFRIQKKRSEQLEITSQAKSPHA